MINNLHINLYVVLRFSSYSIIFFQRGSTADDAKPTETPPDHPLQVKDNVGGIEGLERV